MKEQQRFEDRGFVEAPRFCEGVMGLSWKGDASICKDQLCFGADASNKWSYREGSTVVQACCACLGEVRRAVKICRQQNLGRPLRLLYIRDVQPRDPQENQRVAVDGSGFLEAVTTKLNGARTAKKRAAYWKGLFSEA